MGPFRIICKPPPNLPNPGTQKYGFGWYWWGNPEMDSGSLEQVRAWFDRYCRADNGWKYQIVRAV